MKKLFPFIIIISLFLFPNLIFGRDGNEFHKNSQNEGSYSEAYDKGYIEGFINGKRNMLYLVKYFMENQGLKLEKHPEMGWGYFLWRLDTEGYWCTKEGVTLGQLWDIVTIYIKNNPAERHKHLDILINNAMKKSEIYSCDGGNYQDTMIQKYIKTTY